MFRKIEENERNDSTIFFHEASLLVNKINNELIVKQQKA